MFISYRNKWNYGLTLYIPMNLKIFIEQMDGKTEPPYYNADSQKYIIGMLIEVILIVRNILKVKNSS